MPADPQAPKMDERRWVIARRHPMTSSLDGPKLALGESVEVVPASQVAALRGENERLREAAKLVADDAYKSKLAYEKAQAEVARLTARPSLSLSQIAFLLGCFGPSWTGPRIDELRTTLRALRAELIKEDDGAGA